MLERKCLCHLIGNLQNGFVNYRTEHIAIADFLLDDAQPMETLQKPPNDRAQWHYAPDNQLTIVMVDKGQHTIQFFGDTGSDLIELIAITLNVGDVVVFYDWQSQAQREAMTQVAFDFSEKTPRGGHKSVAGPQGAMLRRWGVLLASLSPAKLDFLQVVHL